jgi:hypothetical protein
MNKTLESELATARKELADLQSDLPQFHALLTENERDAQRLRTQKASLDAQSQARGRMQIAREMLEQHRVDIAAAHAEVARLEALKHREQKLEQMHTAAHDAKVHREAMDKAFDNAEKALHRATELILKEWQAEHDARQTFAQVGTELVPSFSSISNPPWAGMTNEAGEQLRAGTNALMVELTERGSPINYATDGATGRHSSLDAYAKRELPRDELSLLIWQAFLLIAGDAGKQFARFVPKPNQPIHVR